MFNANKSLIGGPTQAYNEASSAFNSSGNSTSKCFIKSQNFLIFNSKTSILGLVLISP